MTELLVGMVIVLLGITILCIVSLYMDNPLHGPPPPKSFKRYPTVAEVKAINAAKKAAREVAIERGKVLAFSRKPWYRSSRKQEGK